MAARTVAEVIAGEAVGGSREQRIADMRAIASVIANRAQQLGVTMEQVVANSNEFNAYGKSLPPGVGQNLVDLAQEQVDYVAENGPTTNATFYATPSAANSLPSGLNYENATTGHEFYSDPKNRAIGTSLGYIKPSPYAYAQNPANVPTPYSPSDLTNNSLLSAFSPTTQSENPFSSILTGKEPANWGANPNVAPALIAPVETWSNMASANPVKSPLGSVQASGDLSLFPGLNATATANPLLSAPASATLGTNPGLSASATVSGFPDVATPSSRMGIAEPGFDNSRFDGAAPSVATGFDPGRFGPVDTAAFDASRFGPSTINPATNTQSFTNPAPTPANLGSFPGAYEAQRGPTRGLLSADAMTVQGMAEKQLAENIAARSVPSLNVPAAGLLSANSPLSAQATVPSLDMTTTASTTPQQQAAGYSQAAQSMAKAGMLNIGQQPPTDLSGELPTNFDVLGTNTAPALDTIQIADQPTIAGPASEDIAPAVTQQAQQAVQDQVAKAPTQPAQQTTQSSPLGGLINKGTVAGGLLGSLAAGPIGGLIGALVGNGINNGGLTNPFSGGGFVAPTTQIGGGVANIGGIYGGQYSPGTYAVASNSGTVTAQPGGYTNYTNPYGVTETISPTGQVSHNFGSLF
jgi:hypothetical protein